jgi:hypothetical protein
MAPKKFNASCKVLEHALADFIILYGDVEGPADAIAILGDSAKRMMKYVRKYADIHGAIRCAAGDAAEAAETQREITLTPVL